MRVLLVGDHPPPAGGVAVHVAALARAVRAAGGEARVLDIGKGQLPRPGVVPAGGHRQFMRHLAWHSLHGWRVHLHTSGANWKSWALVAAGGASPAPVVTFHSGLMPAWLESSSARRAAARAACARYAAILCVSQRLAEALVKCGVESARVVSPFAGLDETPGALPDAAEAAFGRHPRVVVAALARGPEYGADLLFHGFAKLRKAAPDAGLVAFGPGSDELDGRARRAGIDDATTLLGELARPAGLGVVAAAHVFVRPTYADGDALTVREALALGRPVVASDVAPRPPGTLLFRTGDALALSDALLAALSRDVPAAPPSADGAVEILELYRALSTSPRCVA